MELEGCPSYGLFFNIYVETGAGASEEECLSLLACTSKETYNCYVVKRVRH